MSQQSHNVRVNQINATTVRQAAEQLGVHPRRLQRVCSKNGVGQVISKTMRLLTPRDIKQLPKLLAIDRRKLWRKERRESAGK